jgi:hypothetical protein
MSLLPEWQEDQRDEALRMVAIVTLILLGISALIGAIPLIIDPSGAMLRMPLSLLEHSPFSDYLIPGIILLVADGLLSFLVLISVLRRVPRCGWWVVLQGCVLFGWITIEVVMIRAVFWAHYVYWAVALVMVWCGWLLKDEGAKLAEPTE